jgi:hypothetical protein
VRGRAAASEGFSGFVDWSLRFGCSTLILAIVVGYLVAAAVCFAVWIFTGSFTWVEFCFSVPGALLLVFLPAVELAMSAQVVREFTPGQPLHNAWRLIAISAGCEMAGAVEVHLLGNKTLSLLHHPALISNSTLQVLQQSGFVLGGTCRFGLLSAGLFWTLHAYRRAGFLARLTPGDWAILAAMGAFVVRESWDLVVALQHGKHPGLAEMMGWPLDPMLCLLMGQAILLFRSARHMGQGWISRCWQAFSVGLALVVLGNFAGWATNYGYLPWPWSSLNWLVWLPAAGAFALAPVYQLEAISRTQGTR